MGLKSNIAKTKVMRFNAVNYENGMVNGEDAEDVDSFSIWKRQLLPLVEQMVTSYANWVKQKHLVN